MVQQSMALWIGHYGYPAIFFLLIGGIVGVPIPDQLLLARISPQPPIRWTGNNALNRIIGQRYFPSIAHYDHRCILGASTPMQNCITPHQPGPFFMRAYPRGTRAKRLRTNSSSLETSRRSKVGKSPASTLTTNQARRVTG